MNHNHPREKGKGVRWVLGLLPNVEDKTHNDTASWHPSVAHSAETHAAAHYPLGTHAYDKAEVGRAEKGRDASLV